MVEDKEIMDKLLEIVKSSYPETVEALVERAEVELNVSKDVALDYVVKLESEGRLKLTAHTKTYPGGFSSYMFSVDALWFWIAIILAVSTTISVFTVSEGASPLVYIRYVLGMIFVIFLPGFSLVKALFPTREIDNIERFALNIGMSLALVPLVGLLLNYTPWGIRLTPIILSLLALTTILTIVGLIREYQAKTTSG